MGDHKYVQVYEQLVGEMADGVYGPGDPLPPEPMLAERFGIARGTIRQALDRMERRGLIRRVRGRGTFVRDDAPVQLRRGLDAVALLVPEQAGFYPSLMDGFEQASAASRNQVIVVNTRNNAHVQGDAILQLIDKQVAGVVIVPVLAESMTPAYQVRQLQRHQIPVVLCHRGVLGTRAPVLALRGREIGRRAGEELARLGHRRVAFVAMLRTPMAESYEAGLRAALVEAGGGLPDRWAIYSQASGLDDPARLERAVEAVIARLLDGDGDARPSAIFSPFDAVAEVIYVQLLRRGLSAPEDVSLVSFGGVVRLGPTQHRLAVVTVDEGAIGRQAAQLLDEMRSGARPIDSDERIDVPFEFHAGQTLGPAS